MRVSAKGKYIHAVMITGDAVFEDNGFSLLPYETRTVAYKQIGDRAHGVLSVEAYTLCCPSCPLLTTDAGCAII